MSKKQNFSMKDLKCEEVVVFTDRAEIKRSIKTKLAKGENEIVVNNVSSFIDHDSFRVSGEGGATVLDVVCQNRQVESTESNTHERAKQLKSEIEELQASESTILSRIARLDKQQIVLNEFANTLAKARDSKDEKASVLASSKDNVNNFLDFLGSYTDRLEKIDQDKFTANKELTKVREQLNAARDNLNRLSIRSFNDTMYVAIVSVISFSRSLINLSTWSDNNYF